ncbi:MAG: 2-enoyl thioester reductase domain-containing protein [Proteobacteria bacterium]|nr:2-enoyl thioester reductase domain-containing protein [Pseudomonadota bacterium]
MRQIEFTAPGIPHEVVACAEVPDPSAPGLNEILVRVRAFPINPADLLTLRGIYPRPNEDTRALGNEAVGEVAATGDGVKDLVVGDRVMLLSLNNWRELRRVKRQEVIKLSSRGDIIRQCGIKVNPATAHLLLTGFVTLKAGDWIIQDAANSGVGRLVIQFARIAGIRTVNVVRRLELANELKTLGGDVVVPDGGDLRQRVAAATNGAALALGFDCVGGAAAGRLASCLGNGGTLVVYGAMSGEQIAVDPALIVFGDLCVRGLWLTRYLTAMPAHQVVSLYEFLDKTMIAGDLVSGIDSVFRAEDIKSAVDRASQPGLDGKVVVRFD